MKVYFTASVTGGRKHLSQYKKIVAILKKLNHQVLSEQIAEQKITADKKLTSGEIFTRQRRNIDNCSCVVAEVTQPSTGVGSEISYALSNKTPVLALFYKDSKNLLSPMIAGNPSDNLYIEHYNKDNLKIKIKNFLRHVAKNGKMRKGKIVVIDGADGSGKQTQAELLFSYLKSKNKKVKYLDFPRYYSSFHGEIIGRFLKGEFGKINEVSPYLISLAYALDRASAKEEMEEFLQKEGIIICNRYTTSNMAHQATKLPEKERNKFLEWLDELEYRVHKIPREDLVIYLHVPHKIAFSLTLKKQKRQYTNGKKLDIAEKNITHQKKAEQMYKKLTKKFPHWVKINCLNKNNKLRSKKDIHRQILTILRKKKII